jgi:hypothetical protein
MGWTQPLLFKVASTWASMVMNHHNEERGRVRKLILETLGIDLAKNLFRVHGIDAKGRNGAAGCVGFDQSKYRLRGA